MKQHTPKPIIPKLFNTSFSPDITPKLQNYSFIPQTCRQNEDIFSSPQLFNRSLDFKASQIERLEPKVSSLAGSVLSARLIRKRTIDLQASTQLQKVDNTYKNIYKTDYIVMTQYYKQNKIGFKENLFIKFNQEKSKMKQFSKEMFQKQLISLDFRKKSKSIIADHDNVLRELTSQKYNNSKNQFLFIFGSKMGEKFYAYLIFLKSQNNDFQPQKIYLNQKSHVSEFIENMNRAILFVRIK